MAALAVPVGATVFFPDVFGENDILLWLCALIPAFLLAYYRGWQGASVALAGGMAVLSVTQAAVTGFGREIDNWPLLLGVIAAYIGISLGIGVVSEVLHRERARAERLSLTDPLTELPNRRFAEIFLDSAFSRADRGDPITVVLFNLDRLKAYNAEHGRSAGDAAIRTFGRLVHGTTRRAECCARYDGGEFISVLHTGEVSGALAYVERVRWVLRSDRTLPPEITASIGVATYRVGIESANELVVQADRALMAAKAAGGDCVRVAREVEPLLGSGAYEAPEPEAPQPKTSEREVAGQTMESGLGIID